MNGFQHLQLTVDEQRLAWLSLDVQGESTNLLTPAVLAELACACTEIRSLKPRGLVVGSTKPGSFVAGADIKHFTTLTSNEQALAFIRQGQAVCQQFEDLPCPTLAMIDGVCLGGGMELALALDYRISSTTPDTRLGLPEVKLGIHPGFGGTVRSIRKLGVLNAMDIMLTGKLLPPQQAQALGLVDNCVPVERLRETAIQTLLTLPAKAKAPLHVAAIGKLTPSRKLLAIKLRQQVAEQARPEHYPAPYALIDLWEKHGGNPVDMYQAEAQSVAQLAMGATARNLVRIFFLQNRLKAFGDKRQFQPRHVHIVGAGTMGTAIAAWCIHHGLRVSLQDHAPAVLANATAQMPQANMDTLLIDPHGAQVSKADVIIEAISENPQAKRQLFAELERKARADAILATNTSCIPLEDINNSLREPRRLIGLQFFNPVRQMPLVEIAHEPDVQDSDLLARACAFVRHINKLPLPVKSSAGFLVNRILMAYLLEGIRLQQQGIPTTIIDASARDCGMAMGPLELADAIGLDVCQHIGEILQRKLGLELPLSIYHLTRAGKLGQKSGEGFYRYRHGKMMKTEKAAWDGNRTSLQSRLMEPMIRAAHICLEQGIVGDADLVDAGVIFGMGFAPFRGGPLHLSTTTGTTWQ